MKSFSFCQNKEGWGQEEDTDLTLIHLITILIAVSNIITVSGLAHSKSREKQHEKYSMNNNNNKKKTMEKCCYEFFWKSTMQILS